MVNDAVQIAVRLELLGGFRLLATDRDVSAAVNRSAKLKSILCYLILQRERAVSRDELIEIFYEDEEQSDPVSALRMQILRIRQILSPLFPEDTPPIISRRGDYRWNPKLPCTVDAEEFERLCQLAARSGISVEERCGLYRAALSCYRGELALGKDALNWSVVMGVRYHGLFITVAEKYAALLQELGDDAQTEEVCLRAIEYDPADEGLYLYLIRALLRQKRYVEAGECYDKIVDVLRKTLGVSPSEELLQLHDWISSGEKPREVDIGQVMSDMRESGTDRSAFFCSFDQFRSIYQLEVRRAVRTGTCMHVAMVTVGDGECADSVMEQVRQILIHNLRSSDVVARYNSSQMIIMLPEADLEDSGKVMERVARAYDRRYRGQAVPLSWQIREMELL